MLSVFNISCFMSVLSLFIAVTFFIIDEDVSGIIWSITTVFWVLASYFNYKTLLNMKEIQKNIENLKNIKS